VLLGRFEGGYVPRPVRFTSNEFPHIVALDQKSDNVLRGAPVRAADVVQTGAVATDDIGEVVRSNLAEVVRLAWSPCDVVKRLALPNCKIGWDGASKSKTPTPAAAGKK
jgi:hypothetical protein